MNKVTIKNMYPLLRIGDLFDQLKREKVFSKTDLRSRYHHVHIKEEDIHKISFWTRYIRYDVFVVPFGLTNSTATLMCFMNSLLHPYYGQVFFCVH